MILGQTPSAQLARDHSLGRALPRAEPWGADSMADFSWRDLPRVAWGPTFKLSLARGVASALIITPFMLSGGQSGAFGSAIGFFIFWSLFSGVGGLATQFFIRGLTLVFAWLPPFVLGAVVMQFVLSLAVACGDPIVFIIHKASPRLLEVKDFGFFNFKTFIFIVKDEDEGADEPEFSSPAPAPRFETRADPGDGQRAIVADTATRNLVAEQAKHKAQDWIETTSNIQNERIRQALEAANSYLDDATRLVHPPTDIDATKADEIDRLVVLAREHLADARAENDRVSEAGVADYIELLDAGAEQYAGMAHALGRRQLAEGARLIERAVNRIERLGKKQGSNATSHLSLYLLSLIHLEMGDRGAALSFIRRAVAANPDDADYRRLQDQIESEIAGSAGVGEPSASGGNRIGFALLATLLVVGGGAAFYFWQSAQHAVPVVAAPVDPNHFDVLPYTAQQVIVAREAALHFRAMPFSRPDIPIVRDTVGGEVLNVTGLVNQSDGAWYQVRMENGATAYFKASLAIPQEEFLATQQQQASQEFLLGQSANGMVSVYATEDADALTIRTVATTPWYTGFIVDVNRNGFFGDANRDVAFGSNGPTSCNQYRLSDNSATGCGGFTSSASYEYHDLGNATEIVRRIPKRELSEGMAGMSLRFEVFNLSTRQSAPTFDATYEYRIVSAPSVATPTGQGFGAFAISDATLSWGVSWNAPTQDAAVSSAINSCRNATNRPTDCREANHFSNACGALATGASSRSWGASWGETDQAARANALARCGRTDCAIQRSVCSRSGG